LINIFYIIKKKQKSRDFLTTFYGWNVQTKKTPNLIRYGSLRVGCVEYELVVKIPWPQLAEQASANGPPAPFYECLRQSGATQDFALSGLVTWVNSLKKILRPRQVGATPFK